MLMRINLGRGRACSTGLAKFYPVAKGGCRCAPDALRLHWLRKALAGLTVQALFISLSCSQQTDAWQHLSPRAERRPAEDSCDRASRNPEAVIGPGGRAHRDLVGRLNRVQRAAPDFSRGLMLA